MHLTGLSLRRAGKNDSVIKVRRVTRCFCIDTFLPAWTYCFCDLSLRQALDASLLPALDLLFL